MSCNNTNFLISSPLRSAIRTPLRSPLAASYGAGGDRVPDYYVSNAGSDANPGTLAAPFATLAKAATVIADNIVIGLDRGSVWEESFNANTDTYPNFTLQDYGSPALPMPLVDGTTVIPPSAWTATAGKPDVYQASLAHTTSNGYATVWENDVQLAVVADTTLCSSTAGSFVKTPNMSGGSGTITIYVHASSGSPATNGKRYKASCRDVNVTAARVKGIWGRRNAQNDGSIFGKNLNKCLGTEGGKHNLFAFKSGDMQDCVAYRSVAAASNEGGGALFVFFAAGDPAKRARMTNCYAVNDRSADAEFFGGVLTHGGSPMDVMAGFDVNGFYVYNINTAFAVSESLNHTASNIFLERVTVAFGSSVPSVYENVKWLADSIDGAPPPGNTVLFNNTALVTANNIAIYSASTSGQGMIYNPTTGSKFTQFSAYSPGGAYKFFIYGATDGRTVEVSRSVLFGVDRFAYFPTANSDFVNNTDNVLYTAGNNLSTILKNVEYTSLATYKAARSTLDQNSIDSNPLFTAVPSSGDFSLSPSSPANTTFAQPVGYRGTLARPDWAILRARWDAGFLGIDGSGADVLLAGALDGLTVPALGAWGLRKQNVKYNSRLIRVRRDSDNAKRDIGMVSGVLDTVELLAFAGSASVFVERIFDQKGWADLIQTTSSAQPRIVNAGVLETQNGKPSISFSTTQWMKTDNDSIPMTGAAATLASVVRGTGTDVGSRMLPSLIDTAGAYTTDLTGLGAIFGFWNNTNFLLGFHGGFGSAVTESLSSLKSVQSVFDGTNHTIFINGTASIPAGITASFPATAALLLNSSSLSGAEGGNCKFSEFALFNSALGSTDRATLNTNQAAFYAL